VAYAFSGRFTKAVQTSQKTIELVKANGQPQELIAEINSRLKLYQANQPYHH